MELLNFSQMIIALNKMFKDCLRHPESCSISHSIAVSPQNFLTISYPMVIVPYVPQLIVSNLCRQSCPC